MSSSRILICAGLGAAALAGGWAGLSGRVSDVSGLAAYLAPEKPHRVSLALPPSLDMFAFDSEQTVIEASFGPALAQNVLLASDEAGKEGTAPENQPANQSGEPPKPMAAPQTPVEGGLVPPSVSGASPSVQGLRVGHSGGKSRVIIDLTSSTDFAYSVGKDGKSVSIVLPGAVWKAAAKGSTKSGGRITGYEYQPMDGGSKVVLMASEPVDIVQVEPKPGEGQGYQLIIDLIDNTQVAQMRKGGLTFWSTVETPAKVAELPAPEPAPPPPAPKVADASAERGEMTPMADYKKSTGGGDWSGFYTGLQAGYDWARIREKHSVRGSRSDTADGPEGGLFLGWGQQYGMWYFGVELAGAYAHAKAKQTLADGKHEFKKNWNYNGVLRVGAAVFDDGLLYLKGGYQASSFKLSSDRPGDVPASSFSGSKTLHGPLVGLGFDYRLTENWFLRTDASYVFYNTWKYTDSAGGSGKVTPSDISLRIGVGYKF